MIKIDKRIEIVSSTKPGLSSMSQKSRDGVQAVLAEYYSHVRVTIVNDLKDLEALIVRQPDLVFLGMKFLPVHPELGWNDPDKIWLADYLEQHDIIYTGSSQAAHELELNKPLAKQRALDAGLQTSPFYVALQNQSQVPQAQSLIFPLFIKPTNRGGGLGVDGYSVAHNYNEVQSKVLSITVNLQSDSLVEEYLPGREFSVAILSNEHKTGFSVMPIELIAPPDTNGDRFLSAEVKSSDSESFLAVEDSDLRTKVCALALNIFRALEARDYGRIDIRLDKFGTPQFLEANLLPSLINGYGNFPKACLLNIGMDYESMILTIVQLALKRVQEQPVFVTEDIIYPLIPVFEV